MVHCFQISKFVSKARRGYLRQAEPVKKSIFDELSNAIRSAGFAFEKRPRAGVPRRLYSQPYSWWKFLDSEPLRCYDLNDNKIAKSDDKDGFERVSLREPGVL